MAEIDDAERLRDYERLVRAEDALRRYGQHDKNCGVNIRWWGVHDGKTSRGTGGCTCGLKAALESLR